MKRILLTGSTGFVGRQILKSLIAKGASVTVTLRPDQNVPDGAYHIRTQNLFSESVEFWKKNCENHSAVIHSAWYTEPGKYLHASENLACLAGTINLFQGAKAAGVSHFQGLGTCLEYDTSNQHLKQNKPIPSSAPIYPTTAYAAAKAAAYMALAKQSGCLSFAWSRLFYLYGEGEHPSRLVPYIHAQLSSGAPAELTSGKQWRDFLDVEKAGAQIANVTLKNLIGPLNICSGDPITVAKFAENIALKYNRPDLIKLGAIPDREDEPHYLVGVPSVKEK